MTAPCAAFLWSWLEISTLRTPSPRRCQALQRRRHPMDEADCRHPRRRGHPNRHSAVALIGPPAAHAAVSSLEVYPTPALRAVSHAPSPRATGRCRTNLNTSGHPSCQKIATPMTGCKDGRHSSTAVRRSSFSKAVAHGRAALVGTRCRSYVRSSSSRTGATATQSSQSNCSRADVQATVPVAMANFAEVASDLSRCDY
jgi:hypothetical protein